MGLSHQWLGNQRCGSLFQALPFDSANCKRKLPFPFVPSLIRMKAVSIPSSSMERDEKLLSMQKYRASFRRRLGGGVSGILSYAEKTY